MPDALTNNPLPAPFAAALRDILVPDETVVWWEWPGDSTASYDAAVKDALPVAGVVLLLGLAGLVWSGRFELLAGAVLYLGLLMLVSAVKSHLVTRPLYAITQHRLFLLRPSARRPAILAMTRAEMANLKLSRNQEGAAVISFDYVGDNDGATRYALSGLTGAEHAFRLLQGLYP